MERISKHGWKLPKSLHDQLELYEGLISTTPIHKTVDMLERKFSDNLQLLDIDEEDNKFFFYFKGRDDYNTFKKLNQLTNNLGWYISGLQTPRFNTFYRYSDKRAKKFVSAYDRFLLFFEAKFDIEVEPKKIPKKLYHITPEGIRDGSQLDY